MAVDAPGVECLVVARLVGKRCAGRVSAAVGARVDLDCLADHVGQAGVPPSSPRDLLRPPRSGGRLTVGASAKFGLSRSPGASFAAS